MSIQEYRTLKGQALKGDVNAASKGMELDEKYASVILRRYVEDTGDAENVYVYRNGEKLMYNDLVKEIDLGA